MITPKQQLLLNKLLISNPELEALDLVVVPSPEYRWSTAVSNRVETILQEIRNKPVVKRSDLLTVGPTALGRIFASTAIIEEYITKLYGPKTCNPLANAPF
jgi:hypothetical protein